ncbi:MAG: glycosyltransferase family 4 protein [Oscillatoriaceae bacterium SKW80]|nr:glycosyltransferase family 4 protein [Oscillatoriaceae bacterium SKYG93]MCX8122001.1 glycosyltransferase family 4 protein [Oscillatoriaceae bacterium SKW80]MDW8454287.1 glycosyltransferase family 1 protein [Oscillatoriaceae cyanobacterium SKYGB_i_bin93]HIK29151.1 glycosyltransferase family 4 protein [Oscillatoriaceae cyanobacterium M7585_C2015_266]
MGNSLLINLSFLINEPTGITTYANNILPQLQQLEPTLLISKERDSFNCYRIPDNMTPEQGSKGHWRRLLWTQFKLPKIYKNLKSRLLFSPLPEAPVFSGCRYVVTVHDLIPLRFSKPFSRLTAYFRYGVPLVLEQAEHIMCDSMATARDVTNFFNIPAEKITVVPLAYDAENFRFLDLPMQNYFLYIGRHDPYKNLHRLVKAFAGIPEGLDCELWIAGPKDGQYTPELVAHIEELGLTKRVRFLGYVAYEKLPVLINQAIALVLPSLWEGYGLPLLEAMACGTPAIASNRSSLPEVAGDAALLIDPYNVGEITDAMQAIILQTSLRARLRELGLARASQFSWAKTGQMAAEILQRYL